MSVFQHFHKYEQEGHIKQVAVYHRIRIDMGGNFLGFVSEKHDVMGPRRKNNQCVVPALDHFAKMVHAIPASRATGDRLMSDVVVQFRDLLAEDDRAYLDAILAFYAKDGHLQVLESEGGKKAKPTEMTGFCVVDDHYEFLVEKGHAFLELWGKIWQHFPDPVSESPSTAFLQECFLCGTMTEASLTHSKAGKAVLISFDKSAFTSYGWDQAQNCATCPRCVAGLAGGFQDLFNDKTKTYNLDAKTHRISVWVEQRGEKKSLPEDLLKRLVLGGTLSENDERMWAGYQSGFTDARVHSIKWYLREIRWTPSPMTSLPLVQLWDARQQLHRRMSMGSAPALNKNTLNNLLLGKTALKDTRQSRFWDDLAGVIQGSSAVSLDMAMVAHRLLTKGLTSRGGLVFGQETFLRASLGGKKEEDFQRRAEIALAQILKAHLMQNPANLQGDDRCALTVYSDPEVAIPAYQAGREFARLIYVFDCAKTGRTGKYYKMTNLQEALSHPQRFFRGVVGEVGRWREYEVRHLLRATEPKAVQHRKRILDMIPLHQKDLLECADTLPRMFSMRDQMLFLVGMVQQQYCRPPKAVIQEERLEDDSVADIED